MKFAMALIALTLFAAGVRLAVDASAQEEAADGGGRATADNRIEIKPSDISVDEEGKASVPDRGDGCAYSEVARGNPTGQPVDPAGLAAGETVVLQAPGCDVFYWYTPADGRLQPLIAIGGKD